MKELLTKFPRKFVERIKKILPEKEWKDFFTECTAPLPKIIRVTQSPFHDEFIKPENWDLKPVTKIPHTFFISRENQKALALGKTFEHFGGKIYSVSASSLLSAEILNPQLGDKVLDMCAAPGSKATFIAEKIGQKDGLLVANELSATRSKKLASNIDRLGLINVVISQNDGTYMNNFFEQEFDKILLDAPCSSEGYGRKKSDFFAKSWDENKIFECSKLQRKLIVSAFEMLAPAGEMIYSTCTSAPEENEMVVDFLCEKFPDSVEILPIDLGEIPHTDGITEFNGIKISPEVAKNVKRIWPHKKSKKWDSEIFFIAKIRKIRGISRENVKKYASNNYLKVLNKNKTAEVIVRLCKRYEIPRDLFKKLAVIEKDHAFFLTNKYAANYSTKNAHRRTGLSIIDKYGNPTTDFSRTFGTHCTKNVINLDKQQMKDFFAGKNIIFAEKIAQPDGDTLIVKYLNQGIGWGKIIKNGKQLKNKLERNLVINL